MQYSSRCRQKKSSTGRKGLNMKINIPVRFKNPWFWVTLAGLFFTAIGVSPETLTSWDALRQAMVDFISNPFLIASAAVALLGQFIDPTTAGIFDSKQAMGYTAPKRDDA